MSTHAKCLYDYDATDSEELTFREGDVIEVTMKADDWSEGVLNGKKGSFPSNYVEFFQKKSAAPRRVPPRTTSTPAKEEFICWVKAIYDYDATAADELTIKEGDVLGIVRKEDDNWWIAKKGRDQGMIPSNYVKIYTSHPITKKKRNDAGEKIMDSNCTGPRGKEARNSFYEGSTGNFEIHEWDEMGRCLGKKIQSGSGITNNVTNIVLVPLQKGKFGLLFYTYTFGTSFELGDLAVCKCSHKDKHYRFRVFLWDKENLRLQKELSFRTWSTWPLKQFCILPLDEKRFGAKWALLSYRRSRASHMDGLHAIYVWDEMKATINTKRRLSINTRPGKDVKGITQIKPLIHPISGKLVGILTLKGKSFRVHQMRETSKDFLSSPEIQWTEKDKWTHILPVPMEVKSEKHFGLLYYNTGTGAHRCAAWLDVVAEAPPLHPATIVTRKPPRLTGNKLLRLALNPFPDHWAPMKRGPKNNVLLYDLAPGDKEWTRILKRMQLTMPRVKIHRIRRVQNRYLYEAYASSRAQMAYKNLGIINELELFHGTGVTDPKLIYAGSSSSGFETRFSGLFYGTGAYFAESALYSGCGFEHTKANGHKEMFLANVLTGFAKDYGTTIQKKLKRPPDVPYKWHPLWEDASTPGIYDSVRGGPHSGTIMYVAYEKGYAYPSYLIEFS